MLNALFAPPPAASSAAAKSHVGAVASANDEGAANGFAQKLDQANAQPPKGPEARPRDKVRGPPRGASGNEPAKAEPVPKPVPAQEEGKDRRTVPPEGEGDGKVDSKVDGNVDSNVDSNFDSKSTGKVDVEGDGGRDQKGAAVEPTSAPGVTALLAELRAAAPAGGGAARRGADVSAAIGETPASALSGNGAPARTRRGEPGGESAQEGSAGGQRDSFAQQLLAASAQDASALRADNLPTATNPLMSAAMTAAATHSAHAITQAAAQASAQALAQASAGMPTEAQLPATPGSAQFGAQLGAQISTFVQGGIEHARLHLNPAEMGPVSVQIQIDGQTARVILSAENAHTRQALEQALPHLAGSLREAGLTLSGGGVFEQPRHGGGAQAGSGFGSRSDGGPGGGSQSGSRSEDTQGNRADDGLRTAGSASPARRRGVVDLVA